MGKSIAYLLRTLNLSTSLWGLLPDRCPECGMDVKSGSASVRRPITRGNEVGNDSTNRPLLTVGLVQRGHSADDIRKILGGNLLRVLKDIEARTGT